MADEERRSVFGLLRPPRGAAAMTPNLLLPRRYRHAPFVPRRRGFLLTQPPLPLYYQTSTAARLSHRLVDPPECDRTRPPPEHLKRRKKVKNMSKSPQSQTNPNETSPTAQDANRYRRWARAGMAVLFGGTLTVGAAMFYTHGSRVMSLALGDGCPPSDDPCYYTPPPVNPGGARPWEVGIPVSTYSTWNSL